MAFTLLHCADLHLGQRLFDQDRSADEDHALQQIAQLCIQHVIDVVIVAGDVFDTANPGSQEMARYHRWLNQLVHECGVATVIVTAGNHDNALRIEGPKELLRYHNIHVVGSWHYDQPASDIIIPLTNRAGEHCGTCAAIPYLRDGDVRPLKSGEDHATAAQHHRDAFHARCAEIHEALPKNIPSIITAHAFVTGKHDPDNSSGSERPIQVGNLGKIDAPSIAGPCTYLALGHLHRPHCLSGQDHWRYSGSLLPTGFDEIDHQRSIPIVHIDDNHTAQVACHPLTNYRDYQTISGFLAEVEQTLRQLPDENNTVATPWLKILLQDQQLPSGCHNTLTDLAVAKGYRLLGVQRQHTRPNSATNDTQTSAATLDHILHDPEQVFQKVLQHNNIDPSSEQGSQLQGDFVRLMECADDIIARDG